jgi:hypothetical protein
MAFSPMVIGQLSPAFKWTWQDDSGAPIDVSGSTLSVVWTAVPSGTQRNGDGVHTIVNGPLGQTTYQQTVTDMAVTGTFHFRYKCVLPSGRPLFSDEQELVITPV